MTQKSQTDNPLPPLAVLVNPSAIPLSVALKSTHCSYDLSLLIFYSYFSSFSLSLFVILFPFVIVSQ